MSETNRCPNCGAERPAHASEGLCLRCLLRVGRALRWVHLDPEVGGFHVLPRHGNFETRLPRAVSRQEAGLLRGSDPRLKDSYIMVTGHYDHLGVRAYGSGDSKSSDDKSSDCRLGRSTQVIAQCPADPTSCRKKSLLAFGIGQLPSERLLLYTWLRCSP